MATWAHTPHGRGFDTSLVYFHHCNDYWSRTVSNATDGFCSPDSAMVDFWNGTGPALLPLGQGSVYEEHLLVSEAERVITTHGRDMPAVPLFLYYASHVPHTPMQVPQRNLDAVLDLTELSLPGRGYAAMIRVLDEAVANVTLSLRAAGMWDRTLFVLQSDNGGPIYDSNWRATGSCPSATRPGMTGPSGRAPYSTTCLDFGGAATNHPLKGGKASMWEGGIRVAGFVSGGVVPVGQRGTHRNGFIHTADWYSTFAGLAGVDPTDHRAKTAGLPPIDSVDCWDYLVGATAESPRTEFPIGGPAKHNVRGIISGSFKLMLGHVPMSGWTGPTFPNASSAAVEFGSLMQNCTAGCLYDIFADPTEHTDLAAGNPAMVETLLARLLAIEQTEFDPDRGEPQPAACATARGKWSGHYGPWVDVDGRD